MKKERLLNWKMKLNYLDLFDTLSCHLWIDKGFTIIIPRDICFLPVIEELFSEGERDELATLLL